jgi:hypothetical protein
LKWCWKWEGGQISPPPPISFMRSEAFISTSGMFGI